jgi:hypothetical protein
MAGDIKQDLIATLERFEESYRHMAAETPGRVDRVLHRKTRSMHDGDLDFTIAIKEISGKPKFMTVVFEAPEKASYIFFTYGPQGERFFNRKLFTRMYRMLKEHGQVEHFKESIEAELE